MKKLLTILFVIFCLVTFCQDTAFFKTGDERTIFNYQVQKSKDTGTWTSIATLEKGKKSYWYILPKEASYYRVQASGLVTYVTKPILLTLTDNAVSITSAQRSSSYLTWKASGEKNLSYYLIEKSTNSWKTYSLTAKVTATGAAKYSYKYAKTIFTYKYRVRPVFIDLSKGLPITFQ